VQTCDQDVLAGPLASHPDRMARGSGSVTGPRPRPGVEQVTWPVGGRGCGRTCATLDGVSALLVSRLHVDLQRTSSAVCPPLR
jgi:hypothetical protein